MKIIERPESTTYIDEISYHYIKDQKEYDNVMQGLSEKDIVVMRKSANPVSFAPMVWFAIPSNLRLASSDQFISKHFFYVVNLNNIKTLGIKL